MIYQAFYGLADMPFRPTPDPRYLFASARHRLALSQLTYAVGERTGLVVVLTGEPGTGKTTLLRTLLQGLDPSVPVAYIHNAALTMEGLVEYMLEDWGVQSGATRHTERLVALEAFLVDHQRGRRPLLVIDEAHTLSVETLEALGRLPDTLLQIVLVGQPELRDKLDLPQMRHMAHHISQRCHLTPLSDDETRLYVRHRLAVAGAPDPGVFTDTAIKKIAEYSEGTPRVINLVCDLCLVSGYADGRQRIDADAVANAIAYLEDSERPATSAMARLSRAPGAMAVWAARGGIAVLVVMLVGLLAFAVNAMGMRVPGTP